MAEPIPLRAQNQGHDLLAATAVIGRSNARLDRSLASEIDVCADWEVRLGPNEGLVRWDGAGGPPAAETMFAVRKPRSSKRAKHIPVDAYSVTTKSHLRLESGLEHDLVRILDRDPNVRWLVAQPMTFRWLGHADDDLKGHTPDVLQLDRNGKVTIWDVRNPDKLGRKFARQAALTKAACRQVGWTYRVFTGMTDIARQNYLWLHGYRRRPDWLSDALVGRLVTAATQPDATVSDLMDLDNGTGEAIAAMWHLIWTGEIWIDLERTIKENSPVRSGTKLGSGVHFG